VTGSNMKREAEPDVIEHGGGRKGDRLDRADHPPWSALPARWIRKATTRRWIGLVLAFVVGAAAGIAGWRAAESRAERSDVALVAWMGYSGINEVDGKPVVEAYVRLHNAGSLPVRIDRLELVQPGLTPRDTLPDELQVAADETATMSVRSDLRCAEVDDSRPPGLVVQARPADGRTEEVRLTLADTGDLIGFAGGLCGAGDSAMFEAGMNYTGGATVTGARRAARLRVPVTVGAYGPASGEMTLTGVRSDARALVLEPEGLPVRVPTGGSAPLTLVWRVADCTAAADLSSNQYTNVVFTGRREDLRRELSGNSDLGPEVLLALVRFVDTACLQGR